MTTLDGITRRPRSTRRALLFAALLALLPTLAPRAAAQVGERVVRAFAGEYLPGAPLSLTIEFTDVAGLRSVRASYRFFGQGTWTVREAQITGNAASYAIPAAELRPGVLEYWFSFDRAGGGDSTYPAVGPELQPLTVELGAPGSGAGAPVILSPEPGEHVNRGDVLISCAIDRAGPAVDPARTVVLLDDRDLSAHALVSDGLVVVRPENAGAEPDGGSHTVRVYLYDTAGAAAGQAAWSFFVRGPRLSEIPREARGWAGRGNVLFESRHETVSGLVTPYNRATLDGRAGDGVFELAGHLHLTSEERETRQPQHRFFLGAESPWARLGYGDSYPVMPDMIISGKRVRGLNGALTTGFFHLEVVSGDIVRNTPGDTLRTFPVDSLASEQASDPAAPYGPYDASASPARWAKYRPGAFDRSLFIVRPSFRFGQSVLGFTALHSKDDVASTKYGGAPEENAVGAADLTLSFDRRNVEVRAQAGFSLYNNNIRGGTISDERIDSLFSDDTYDSFSREDLEDARDIFSRVITVNENLVPLGVKNLATLSWEGSVAVNYQPNAFSLTWMRHGASYVSFGQPFYRRDVVGFSATDRLRLADNRLQLSAGFERLRDNTAETKPATTTFTTVSAGASWLSRNEMPNITLGFLSATNRNRLAFDSPWRIYDNTLRFLLQASRQVSLAGLRHFVSAGFSAARRADRTAADLDSRSASASLGVVTTVDANLRTSASATFFSTEISAAGGGATTIDYAILFAGGEYRLQGGRVVLTASLSPTLGDISRTLVGAGARWSLAKALTLEGKLDLYLYDAADTDVIWSLVLRADV